MGEWVQQAHRRTQNHDEPARREDIPDPQNERGVKRSQGHTAGKTDGRRVAIHELPFSLWSGNILIVPRSWWLDMQIMLKEVDSQGRIVLPAAWRRKHLRGDKVLLRPKGDVLEVVPREKVDLTAYFDAAEADVKSDLADWHGVRKELQKR